MLSVITELNNMDDVHTMVVEATFHLGMGIIARVTIPPGERKDICYDIFSFMDNPDRQVLVYVYAVKNGLEDDKKKQIINQTLIRDNASLLFNYENEVVNVVPVQGNIMARICCIVWLRRTIAGFWNHMEKIFKQP